MKITATQKQILISIYREQYITRGPRKGQIKYRSNLQHIDGRSLNGLIAKGLLLCKVGEFSNGSGFYLSNKGIEIATA